LQIWVIAFALDAGWAPAFQRNHAQNDKRGLISQHRSGDHEQRGFGNLLQRAEHVASLSTDLPDRDACQHEGGEREH
jgi:hypothetical protein